MRGSLRARHYVDLSPILFHCPLQSGLLACCCLLWLCPIGIERTKGKSDGAGIYATREAITVRPKPLGQTGFERSMPVERQGRKPELRNPEEIKYFGSVS